MSDEFGWWLLPLIVTVYAFARASQYRASGPYDFGGLFVGGAALIVSLVAWLIWAVLT